MATTMRHVHLRATDLEGATAFYRDILGVHVTVDGRSVDPVAVYLAAAESHHHVALSAAEAGEPSSDTHRADSDPVTLVYPDRAALARAVRRLLLYRIPLEAQVRPGAVAVSVTDPDGNAVRLSYESAGEAGWDASDPSARHSGQVDPRTLLMESAA
jgi:catechol 2,3-dioxygenase